MKTLKETYFKEDTEQRLLRSKRDERAEEYQLPNIDNFLPPYLRKKIPYFGQKNITIYRGISKDDPNATIQPGDWIALDRKYAAQHGSGKIIKAKAPAKDVVWAGTDENEWWYVPE